MDAEAPAAITVLAGVNGAGKSSIGGARLRAGGAEYFNPDEAARSMMAASPQLDQTEANALAWAEGKALLEAAIKNGTDYVFESTLGGKSITDLLVDAARAGVILHVWYVGLESVELHLLRVAARVKAGGHDIPESDIRKRWEGSQANLVRLIPYVTTLQVYDNSSDAGPHSGSQPVPRLLLSIKGKRLIFPRLEDLPATPQWAKAVVFEAFRYFGMLPPL